MRYHEIVLNFISSVVHDDELGEESNWEHEYGSPEYWESTWDKITTCPFSRFSHLWFFGLWFRVEGWGSKICCIRNARGYIFRILILDKEIMWSEFSPLQTLSTLGPLLKWSILFYAQYWHILSEYMTPPTKLLCYWDSLISSLTNGKVGSGEKGKLIYDRK